MMRGGTSELHIETGRWAFQEVQEREYLVCASGIVEDEIHVLLGCISYEILRRRMFREIRGSTGDWELIQRREDKLLVTKVLIGEGVSDKRQRAVIYSAVARLSRAFKKRKVLLNLTLKDCQDSKPAEDRDGGSCRVV